MNDNSIKVLCVDDNPLVRQAIESRLRDVPGIEWLGDLSEADSLAAIARARRPDVVLLDIDMPGRDVFDALEDLTESCPDVHVLMFSGVVRSDLIERAFNAGAWGFVSKNDSSELLVQAIKRVADGEVVLGPEVQMAYWR